MRDGEKWLERTVELY
jgi:hypothetical protein